MVLAELLKRLKWILDEEGNIGVQLSKDGAGSVDPWVCQGQLVLKARNFQDDLGQQRKGEEEDTKQ